MFKILFFKKLNSTNSKAKSVLKPNLVVVAEEQTSGKGRFKRKWSSQKGGLYASIVLKIEDKPQYLTFIAALSVYKAVKDVYGLKTTIKWPNDLIYNKKKLCGILTETLLGKEKLAIVGIGINTNNKIPSSLKSKAISLSNISGKKINNERLLKSLLKHFEKYYSILKNKEYSKIISDWKKNSFLGSKVKVKTLGKKYSGTAFDVDKDCFLVIKDKEKKIKIKEGDISINTNI